MRLRGFILSSGVTYVGTATAVGLTIAFYSVSLRIGVEEYGTLQSIMSFMFLLSAGRGAAGGYVVMHAGGDERALGGVVKRARRLALVTAMVIGSLIMAASPFLRDFLHLESNLSFLLIGIAAIPSLLAGMIEGILNVQRRFTALMVSSLIAPLMNVVFAVVFLRNGLQDGDVGLIVLCSQGVNSLNTLFIRWKSLQVAAPYHPARSSFREVVELIVSSLLFGASLRLDIFWSKHLLSPTEAGSYAIAASIAVVLFIISSGAGRVASVSLRNGSGTSAVLKSYALIATVSSILAVGFVFFGNTALGIVTGKTADIDWAVLAPLFVALTLYSIIALDYTCLNVITKRVHMSVGATLLLLQGTMLVSFGTDARSIALAQCVSMTVVACSFSILLLRELRSLKTLPDSHPAQAHFSPEQA